MSILDHLYSDEVFCEKAIFENGNYNAAYEAFFEISEQLRAVVPENMREKLDDLRFCAKEMEFQCSKEAFAIGFSLGKCFIGEVNNKNNSEKAE